METEFLRSMACDTHVSLLEALTDGVAEGACIGIGYGSVMAVVVAFAAGVLVLQWIARRALAAVRGAARPPAVQGPVWSASGDRDAGGPIDSL